MADASCRKFPTGAVPALPCADTGICGAEMKETNYFQKSN